MRFSKEFRNARALVVDVRGNGGGDDRVGRAIASRFTDRNRLYMTVALRNGPKHDDFAAPGRVVRRTCGAPCHSPSPWFFSRTASL